MDHWMSEARKRIIFPLDVNKVDDALELVDQLYDYVGAFKVGFEFVTGSYVKELTLSEDEAIEHLIKRRRLFAAIHGREFWDGKFNDIPNTVGAASAILGSYGVSMFNVHASANIKAIEAAAKSKGSSKLLVVTVLTSFERNDCERIFGNASIDQVVERLVTLCPLLADGVICSPEELAMLSEKHPWIFQTLLKVIAGVRPVWASTDDQKRVMTPGEAIRLGADYLVIGRPIRKPPTQIGGPVEAAKRILEEIAEALEFRLSVKEV